MAAGKIEQIFKVRLQKEKALLDTLDKKVYDIKISDRNDRLDVNINPDKKNEESYAFSIHFGHLYPFQEPTVKLRLSPVQHTLINLTETKNMQTFIKREWTPNVTWKYLILSIHNYLKKNIKPKPEKEEEHMLQGFGKLGEPKSRKMAIAIVLLIALIFRIACGFGGYSGVNDPPQYGDYEAQRHWMELTINLPAHQWYTEVYRDGKLVNDFKYWRLDYPPLSGYLSYIYGYFSRWLDPKSMELYTSRGYETPFHKMFMRSTVLITDLLLFTSAIVAFVLRLYKKYNFETRMAFLLLILLSPLMVLIDHGHFQYNCAMLGFILWAIILVDADDYWIGSILFVFAMNVKQMALYFAIPFFSFYLGRFYQLANLHRKSSPNESQALKWLQFAIHIVQAGIFVLLTMAICWWPWLTSLDNILNVVQAIFPIKRGLYQLKVASFWCASDIFIKWQNLFDAGTLVKLSIAFTLIASLPSAIVLLRMPKMKYFKVALFNVSMAFFFFSYHVHEKTILVPLLPLLLNVRYFRHFYVDFSIVAAFTNYHMLLEDKLGLQYFVFVLFYAYFGKKILKRLNYCWDQDRKIEDKANENKLGTIIHLIEALYTKLGSKLLYAGMAVLTVADKIINPPERYPFLFQLLFAMVGFVMFSLVFVYSNLKMYHQYSKDKKNEEESLKYSIKDVLGKNE